MDAITAIADGLGPREWTGPTCVHCAHDFIHCGCGCKTAISLDLHPLFDHASLGGTKTQYCPSCGTHGEGTCCSRCGAAYPASQTGYQQYPQYAQYPPYAQNPQHAQNPPYPQYQQPSQYQQPYPGPYPPPAYGQYPPPYAGYYPQPYAYPQQDEGTLALVMGGLGLLMALFLGGVGGIVFGCIAMALGKKYEAEGRRHGRTGFILGLVAVVLGTVMLFVILWELWTFQGV